MIAAKLLGHSQTEFLKSFEIVIQLGAILSVLVIYWRSFLIKPEELKRVICAFIPTALVGFVLYKFIKRYLLADVQIVLWSLLIGGFVMIFFEKTRKPEAGDTGVAAIPYKKAFLIGLFQSLAVIPGVSRSAATIVGGMLLGVGRRTIVEFSFLLAVPTMAAATALDLLKNGDSFSADQTGFLMIGFVGSFIFAFLCIKWLLNFVKRHTFTGFGIYRIAAALFFMFWFSR
ncbi:MAG: undecaprenyl-diphosphate phosphatase, partial [Candidatus Omnitrophica bacterium]|nr:undecaprenyl-diphosphate phosphatase [Candidatus Omnitrophota bacterium]